MHKRHAFPLGPPAEALVAKTRKGLVTKTRTCEFQGLLIMHGHQFM